MTTLLQRLHPRTIQGRLALWFTAAVLLAVGLFFVLMLVQQQRLLRSEWTDALRAQAQLMATNSQAAFDFQDSKEAARLLQAVHATPSILRARLLIGDSPVPFAEHISPSPAVQQLPSGAAQPQRPSALHTPSADEDSAEAQVVFHDPLIYVWAPVPGSLGAGWVELVASTQPMQQALRRTALETGVALLMLLVVFLWLSGRASRRLAQPLQSLNRLMARAAENPQLQERVPVQGADELAQLARSLNQMIDKLQARDRELTEYRHNLEQLVEQRTQALLHATEEAQAASRAKSDFLARMSHEIRTPMNAIVGLGKLLLKTQLNAHQRDYQEKVIAASDMLLGLINDILDYSRIEAGKLDVESIDFDLEQVLRGVSSQLALRAQQKGLELLIDVPAAVPRKLRGDPLRLTQVLVNLANNAVKFTEYGEIVIQISLQAQHSDRVQLEFSVRDSGMGIPADRLTQLFTPFTQVDGSITRRFGGTGLGLAICRQLVELMGGSIQASSQEGVGSRFFFSLPLLLDPPKPTSASNSDARSAPDRSPLLHGKRVLVVDDNASARDILHSMLGDFGMRVDTVDSGAACISQIIQANAAGDPYHLVLLDWLMPGMDGIEAARHIQAAPLDRGLPGVLMVTAGSYEKLSPQAAQVGLEHILTKPVSPSALHDAMLEALLGSDRSLAPPPVPTDPAAPSPTFDFAPIAGARVLLVDDVELNRTVAQAFLSETGVQVEIAVHGREALEKVLSQPYDLVLMDIQMPEMDGLSATQAIRQEARFKDLPIIAMTAHAMEGDRQRSLDAGMQDHLTKPINPDALYAALLRWIRPRSTTPSPTTPSPTTPSPTTPSPTTPSPVMLSPVSNPATSLMVSTAQVPQPAAAAAAAAVVNIPALQGIDTARGLAQCLGKPELYLRVVGNFVEEFASSAARMAQAGEAQDWPTARRIAHSLKSAAATLGAGALSDLAKELEQGYADAPPPDLASPANPTNPIHPIHPDTWQALGQELTRVLGLLRTLLQTLLPEASAPAAAAPATATPAPSTDHSALLDSLAERLAHDDASALRLIEELRATLHPTQQRSALATLAELREQVEDVEYETALELLPSLRNALHNP